MAYTGGYCNNECGHCHRRVLLVLGFRMTRTGECLWKKSDSNPRFPLKLNPGLDSIYSCYEVECNASNASLAHPGLVGSCSVSGKNLMLGYTIASTIEAPRSRKWDLTLESGCGLPDKEELVCVRRRFTSKQRYSLLNISL